MFHESRQSRFTKSLGLSLCASGHPSAAMQPQLGPAAARPVTQLQPNTNGGLSVRGQAPHHLAGPNFETVVFADKSLLRTHVGQTTSHRDMRFAIKLPFTRGYEESCGHKVWPNPQTDFVRSKHKRLSSSQNKLRVSQQLGFSDTARRPPGPAPRGTLPEPSRSGRC
jgi:hypothetical protein